MAITTNKRFTKHAQDYAFFYNDDGDPTHNIEGLVQLADTNGNIVDPGGASSGATGGGDSSYCSVAGNVTFTPTVGTTNITVTGLPYTLEATHVAAGSLSKIDSSGDISALDTTNVSVSSGVITLANEDNFVSGDEVFGCLAGPDKAYDANMDADIVYVTNPEYAHYTSVEHLVDVSGVGDAVTSRYIIPMESYKNLSFHFKLSNSNAGDTITMTMFATNNSDADDSADTDWVDVTTTILGTATKSVNNGTLEEIHFVDSSLIPLKYMVKTVTVSGGSDTNAADVYIKKA